MSRDRYTITRTYQRDPSAAEVIRCNVTLEAAQAHCNDPETSSSTCTGAEEKALTRRKGAWFDVYRKQ